MYANVNQPARTIKLTTAVGIGLTTFVMGLMIGAAVVENGYYWDVPPKAAPATCKLFATTSSDLKNWSPGQQMCDPRAQKD